MIKNDKISRMVKKHLISIIATAYNEESILPEYFEALSKGISQLQNISVEVLLINDGSTDQTISFLKQQIDAHLEDPVALIPLMIDQWISGFDIVYTVRKLRLEGFFNVFLQTASIK
jgi:glycosyltransferase involved in cell wall biosynthesis